MNAMLHTLVQRRKKIERKKKEKKWRFNVLKLKGMYKSIWPKKKKTARTTNNKEKERTTTTPGSLS